MSSRQRNKYLIFPSIYPLIPHLNFLKSLYYVGDQMAQEICNPHNFIGKVLLN